MKKVFMYATAFAVTFAFSSCNGGDSDATTDQGVEEIETIGEERIEDIQDIINDGADTIEMEAEEFIENVEEIIEE